MQSISFVVFVLLSLFHAVSAAKLFKPLHLLKQTGTDHRQQQNNRDRRQVIVTAAAASQTEPKQLNGLQLCMAGAFATVIGDFSLHPVDTIKTFQQASSTRISVVEAIKKIYKNQGLKGFYQGVVPYLISDGSSGAVKFAAFEALKKFVEDRTPKEWHKSMYFVSAAGAFIACSFVLVPGEVIKCRLQAGSGADTLKGIISSIWAKDGLRGFFAGYSATLLRDVPYTMLELGLYENIKVIMRNKNKIGEELSSRQEFYAAAVTGAVSASLTTPLDLVKTKLMMQSTSGGGQYTGIINVFQTLYKQDGISGLFSGMTARVTWLLPFTVIYLGVYEASKRHMLLQQ